MGEEDEEMVERKVGDGGEEGGRWWRGGTRPALSGSIYTSDHICLYQKSRRLWPLMLYDASIKVRCTFSYISAHLVPSWTLSHGQLRELGSQSALAPFLSGNLGCFPLAITPVGRYTSSLFFCCLKTDMQQSIDPLVRRTSS